MLVLTLIGIAILLTVIYWYYEYYKHYKGSLSIPRPPMIPVFGHVWLVKKAIDSYWVLHRLTNTYGKNKAVRGVLGFFFCMSISDPEFLEHIMTHPNALNKSRLYRFFHNWLGFGLLTSGAEKWRSRRKLLTPAYHFKILEQFIDVFDKNGSILVRKLQSEVGKGRTDIFPYITLCALDTICETAMGTSVNAQEDENSEFVHATKEMNRIVVSRAISIIKQTDFLYQFTPDCHIEKKSLKILHNYTLSVIAARRQELLVERSIKEEVKDENVDIGKKEKIPFLDLLLQSSFNGEPLTDEDIREEVDTFMFEGHDTVSAAMSFCIYCISTHPQIQANLLEEQREIYGNNPDRDTTYNDLQEMKYLEMVIKETLRLYPSVPLYGRKISKDLEYGDIVLNKGLEVGFFVYSLHRNPEIYPNPDVFDPNRFTLEEQAKRHPFSYLPFSAGSRNCVGQKFAMLEMKSTISKMLRNFVFSAAPDNKLVLKSETILSSASGVPVAINQRIW